MLCAWHSNLQSVIRPGADQQVAVCSEGRSRPTGCSLCGREGALGMLRAWHSRLQCVLREGAPGALCAWQCALLSGWDHLAGSVSSWQCVHGSVSSCLDRTILPIRHGDPTKKRDWNEK
eukprot:scaffold88220_cov18-Tisochrysis_lutea.AAC.2